MKNAKIRFGALVLALVMCFGLLVSCGDKGITLEGVKKDPYAAIVTGYEKYADALDAKYGKVFEVFDKLAEGTGTYSAAVTVPEMGDVNVNAVVDAKAGTYSGKATIGAMGFTTEASLWGDKNNIAVKVPALLGEGTYGVKFDTLEADLEGSELISSITGGMSFEDLKATLETEAGIKWDDLKNVYSVDKWKTAFDKYIADVQDLMKAKEYTVAEENAMVGETAVPAISVQYVQTAEDSKKVAELAVDMIESVCGDIIAASGMSIDDLKDQMMAEGAMDEMGDVSTKVLLNKKTGAIVSMYMSSENVKMDMVLGEDASKMIDVAFDYELTLEGQTTSFAITAKEVTDEGKDGFDIDVTANVEGEESLIAIDIVRNDADGKYEIKVSGDGEELGTIAGTLTYSAEEIKLTVDSMTSEGETTEIGLSLSAKAGGTVETVPAYTNILTATAEELEGLMEMIGSMMYTPDYGYEDVYGDYDYEDIYGEYEDIYGDFEGMEV